MPDRGQQGFAGTDEGRKEEGHLSHEKGAVHEFNREENNDGGRKGMENRQMSHAARETMQAGQEGGMTAGSHTHVNGGTGNQERLETNTGRPRKTRGGTHDQHVTAGKKGGSRIRQLIELGYKYEEEHGIGPGRNERSKLAAKRRAAKSGGEDLQNETGGEGELAEENAGD